MLCEVQAAMCRTEGWRAGAHPQRQHETELGATLQPSIDSCPQFDGRRAQILRAALGVRVILCQRLQLMRDLY